MLYDLKKFAGAGVLDGPEALRRRKLSRAGRIRPLRMTGNMVINLPGRLVVYGLATDVALPCVGGCLHLPNPQRPQHPVNISPHTDGPAGDFLRAEGFVKVQAGIGCL